jgi:hypothetical protein
MNCYSRYESENDSHQGSCLQITELTPSTSSSKKDLVGPDDHTHLAATPFSEIHTVDFEFSPPPLFAHFVRIDGGLHIQHDNPKKAMLDPSFDFTIDSHPNTAMLNVPSHSSVIIIWRNKSLMDHPMHLHGYKMEILKIDLPVRNKDCTLSKCKLNTAFDLEENKGIHESIPTGSNVLKDTFILPAGGAVVTRIQTKEPALWYAHCHIDVHKEDGMAFILNVGNYQQPSNGTWLPEDYPSCDTQFQKTQHKNPACHCYINSDAILDGALTEKHRCSREHLCLHEQSLAANLDSYKSTGFSISSNYRIPNFGISLIIVSIIIFLTVMITRYSPKNKVRGQRMSVIQYDENYSKSSNFTFLQKFRVRFTNDWRLYRPGCTNPFRVFEVTGLALLTGYLFYDIGNDSTANGLSGKYSLLFFSITLWTFTRMYPAVANYNAWHRDLKIQCNNSISDITVWCISKLLVVIGNEGEIKNIHKSFASCVVPTN